MKSHENIADTRDESTEIPRVSCDELTYDQFHDYFMTMNLPVILTGLKIKTETSEKWFEEEKFKIENLLPVLNDHKVPVADCTKNYFNSHEKLEMTFCDYADYWNGDRAAGNFYLKDFHLKQEFPDLDFYNLPRYFANDWLNEFLIDNEKDDFRFIYFGTKGTWTSFHSDVCGSYSWSANIYGRKHWLLLQPKEEQKLKDNFGHLPFSITREELAAKDVKHFDFIQECNETLFVPSGWFHQVRNIKDTVSVNHNWFNGCNIGFVAEKLISQYEEVVKEISDCKDMENFLDHCQLMLKSLFGMNFHDFLEILNHITRKRIDFLTSNGSGEEFEARKADALSDIRIIFTILQELSRIPAVSQYAAILKIINEGINKIGNVLS